jgi:hypothetical protein
MASLTKNINRNVVPNWRDYRTTAELGEIGGYKVTNTEIPLFSINDYIDAWKENKTIPYAGDLISAGIMNGKKNNSEVINAAKFIIENEDSAPKSLLNVAHSFFPKEIEEPINDNITNTSKLRSIINQEDLIKEKVRFLRKLVHRFPENPIWYSELALSYATLGLMSKAEKMMCIALHLAPTARYITRSASRLFLHIKDIDKAHHILVNNPAIIRDPWILASEIAVNASRGRSSRYIKNGIAMINSGNYSSFSLSELCSAIGTQELYHSKKKCELYFNKSLLQPNDNSLSQAEWLLSMDSTMKFKFTDYSTMQKKFEADSRHAFLCENYHDALTTSINWIESMPFARLPIYFAAEMAYTYVKDYKSAIEILKIGLNANPDELNFINNLAYVYAMNGETEKADNILEDKRLSPNKIAPDLNICLIATRGLNEYKKGNIEEGRNNYRKAIELAHNIADNHLANKALLNFIREELIATKIKNNNLIDLLEKLDTGDSRETKAMKNDIMQLINRI